ncbi:DMT family transporter [Chromobacterium haemolyticum]|uniref:DMT family transporter n=1 Tax=Chromobacterium haemolyticum TaxID=394935 RepID=UPI00307EDEB3
MTAYILLALLNGVCIGASRAVNGRMAQERGAFAASWWNHLIGFLLLSALLPILSGAPVGGLANAPASAYLGGALGALFVAVNSHVLTRLGMMKTTLLVITGQMLTGILLDRLTGLERPALTQLLGAALLLAGLWLARRPRTSARA